MVGGEIMSEREPLRESAHKKKSWRSLRTLLEMRRLAKFLWPHARSHKALLLGGALLSALLIALRTAQPWPLKWVIDWISDSHSPFTPTLGWLQLQPQQAILIFSLLYVLVSILAALVDYWQHLVLAGLGNRVLFSFRNQLFSHLLRQPLSFHDRRNVGELVTRVVYDTSRLRRGVNGILTRSFQGIFTFLTAVGVILWLNWRLAVIVGVCGTVALLAMGRTGGKILTASQKHRRREGQLAAIVAEDVHGIRELQTFCPGTPTDERFERRNVKSLGNEQKVRRLAAGLLLRMETLLTISVCLVLWLGAAEVHNGQLSLGSLVLLLHYTVGLYGPFRHFAQQAAQTGRTMACAERLTKLMERRPAVANIPGAISLQAVQGEIAFEKVSCKSPRRHGRKWLLEGISFPIKAGERVAVLGKNGAGKSSLLRLILRLSDPHQGCIRLDGHDLKNVTLESFRKHISVVFQDGVFFGLTVRENIALGNSDASLEEIQHTARRCGIDKWIEQLKQGYNTPVRHQGRLFSGGERQKIALARALLRDGRIWLLDEPTGSLDAESRDGFVSVLLEATQGRTTLWVTHDLGVLTHCDRVLLLGEGKMCFFGTPKEFHSWFESGNSVLKDLDGEDPVLTLKEGS